MTLYQCDNCGVWHENTTGCSDECALLEKFEEVGFLLNIEETKAIIKELGQTFISRDNELCSEVLNKMIQFVNRHEKLDK